MNRELTLLFRATPTALGALPVEYVVETMRPLAYQPIAGAPDFVIGAAVVRGLPMPIVDVGALLGVPDVVPARRWVTLRVGARNVGLAVAEVMGVRRMPATLASAVRPPLLAGAAQGTTRALSILDGELLVVLETTRLISEDVWLPFEKGAAGEEVRSEP